MAGHWENDSPEGPVRRVMSQIHEHLPGLTLGHLSLGRGPTSVRRLDRDLVGGSEVWVKAENEYGDGGWGGNKVRKLEWILPEAKRRGAKTIFTVDGIGTHWGLAATLYGREQGLRIVLGLVDRPVDEHLREEEGEHPDREHRQGDLGPLRDELDAPERQAEVDRESGERAEQDCFSE